MGSNTKTGSIKSKIDKFLMVRKNSVASGESIDTDVGTTRERIIQAAEDLIRRHGPVKTRVVDVARHLNMSHANVYRHFANKADIEDVVAARWLKGIAGPLEKVVTSKGTAEERLREWLAQLIQIKETKFTEDPELFATYNALAEASRVVIAQHVAHLREQLAVIIADGVANGEFAVTDVTKAAQALHEGTTRFQHPYFVTRNEKKSNGVGPAMDLLIAGLKCGVV